MVLFGDVRFVLDLKADNSMFGAVPGLQVLAESGKNFFVSFKSRRAMRGKHPDVFTIDRFFPRETLRVGLDPRRGEIHGAVLPGGKPHQDQLDLVSTGKRNQRIDTGKVILALYRFDLIPKYGELAGIAGRCFNRFESFFYLSFITGTVAALTQELGAYWEKRLPIHDKGTFDFCHLYFLPFWNY